MERQGQPCLSFLLNSGVSRQWEREMIESARERERERKKERGGQEGRWKERASEREGRATEALRGRHTHDTHERRGVAYIGCI